MTRAVQFLWPLRWPLALLLLAAALTTHVPPDSRDAYQLLAIGAVMLLAHRTTQLDLEHRLQVQDRGFEALRQSLQQGQATLVQAQEAQAGRIVALERWRGVVEPRLVGVEIMKKLFFPGS